MINGNNFCTKCFSDLLGYICSCGEMRCSCDREECSNCLFQREYKERQDMYDQEKEDRTMFEDEMDRKYHD